MNGGVYHAKSRHGNQALSFGALRARMETLNAKYVIIGAGAMGSAAAYHLARRGEPVVLIEQFELGHDREGSHGAARITRHSYADLTTRGSCGGVSSMERA